ncbi:MAG TPA: FmdE family protein [Methanosarcina thermophila]|uniref:FmdE, Molybdenum formylmethanofuran dehydrogenase operon n=1 Tax=Methanosarcina thermophila (strain ATCC 43570 / DSM 1825 / OCM 12 / VKM B-1830 / TM-1) TaxID=523844 RepID=A0A0E3NFN3_METTT|nr:FmdE family protein [Methanosarcina thermophila]AKB13917.1 FmdE, Molybdenum formylmethanofuran dehydrogenase operon [Methanosarcina thermophila TM-1]HOQ65661.1 FmdE family protein [Methanosarcina thermophila]HPT80155.1 FmdE family protein [Methanosarcina thermophila]
MNFDTAVQFHGHVCPGLSIGYRVAVLAAERFKDRSKDEELVAIVENRSCAVDAIQAINGCTCGKGNLIFKDHGKHVYTYFKRGDNKALRISLKPDALPQDEKHIALFAKLRAGTASSEEEKEFRESHNAKSQRILEMPEEELFWVREVEIEPPEKAIIYPTLICSKCGEGFMEPLGRIRDGEIVCIPCFEAKDE